MSRESARKSKKNGESSPSGDVSKVPPDSDEHVIEIVSDSGEGAQKAGQTFAKVCAQMGNGVWTVEIIPAEIKPPARSPAGASGIRVRFGSKRITNMGDEATLVVALNEQVLYGRIAQGAYKRGTTIVLENKWAKDPSDTIREAYDTAVTSFREQGFEVIELPLEEACSEHTANARVGKNMFVLGMLCQIFGRDLAYARTEIAAIFKRKGDKVIESNHRLLEAGQKFAEQHVELSYVVPKAPEVGPQVVMNGNQAVGFGVMASGMEMVSMYPITPATSASHFLADVFGNVGGVVHQAEDEIAAIGFAIGASYAGKTSCTITSGPGLALKSEFLGLAVMAEVPLVIVLVQRGGPSTGLPTKVEQGDLLASLFATPGDAPKIVMAAATIEECFHFTASARKIAEAFRTPVIVLSDTNLATGVQPFPRPEMCEEWLSPPVDQSPWQEGVPPYAWDDETGISPRPIPGQPGGEYVLTGLAHTPKSHVAYDPHSNQLGCEMRSRKLAAMHKTLTPPTVHGADEGDLLVVGWGSTLGAIEEAVDRMRADGDAVSSVHLRFISPLEPGLREIFARFKRVMTIEINYGDPPGAPLINRDTRRWSQLAWLLRAHTLIDIDTWCNVHGLPLQPGKIYQELKRRITSPLDTHPAKENAHVRPQI